MKIEASGATQLGDRSCNEDAFAVDVTNGFFVVADGMGGYEGGEVASALVVEHSLAAWRRHAAQRVTTPEAGRREVLDELAMRRTLAEANEAVRAARRGPLLAMGSTAVCVAVRGRYFVMGHVGDSRLYRVRRRRCEVLTRDHSLAEELREAARLAGERAPRDAQQYTNVLMRAVGASDDVEPDIRCELLEEADSFVLCTDGVWSVLDQDDLAELVADFTPAHAAELIVRRAIERGSTDNATAVVIRVSDAPRVHV